MFPSWKIPFTITLFSLLLSLTSQQSFDYPTANLSTSWTNTPALKSAVFPGVSTSRLILLRGTAGPRFACGFYCNGTCSSYSFSIFIVFVDGDGEIIFNQDEYPQVVWSANRNKPVGENAKLELTNAGDLILRDADGSLAWSTNTAGRSVAGLNLTESGNLVLHDAQNRVVWQSFDHPSDVLVPGQIVLSGTNLTASGPSNWSEPGLFALSMTEEGLVASILSNPPQVYLETLFFNGKQNQEQSSAEYENGSLTLSQNSNNPQNQDIRIPIPPATSAQYIKFGPDGHLRVIQWSGSWKEVADLLTSDFDPCSYPLACGRYGICSSGQCSCPVSVSGAASFRPVNNRRPNLGCSEVTPITCNATRRHRFLDLEDVTYFSFNYDIMNTDMRRCKEACLRNCSCKAAVFLPGVNADAGSCYLPNEIFSLIEKGNGLTRLNSSVSLKVQIDPANPPCNRN